MSNSLNVCRFGLEEVKPSQSGQSRLNKYLERLKQTEPQTNHSNNNEHGIKRKRKRKLENTLDHEAKLIPSSPNKKPKLSIDASNTTRIQLCIEENTTQQSIQCVSSPVIKKKEEKQSKTKRRRRQHHPIYDITSFPKIKLPQVINPEKTLMPQPVWIKKGNKIISDIAHHTERKEKESLDVLRLDSRLIDALKLEGYKGYFPVQMNVIPAIVRGMIQKRDIAVCAPTGSGKTLSYVLPICDILCKELSDTSRTLRALVVSPSRDLALQLFLVFDKFAHCVGLKVGLSSGQRSFKDEQSMIMGHNAAAIYHSTFNDNHPNLNHIEKTAIDVLICTPGRLVDHLNHTPGFNVKHLQFLVLDEADRLMLAGSHQDWLFRLYHILDSQRMMDKAKHELQSKDNTSKLMKYNGKICLTSRKSSHYEYKPYLLKILLSATLTHNPKVISSLKLKDPLYFGSSTDKEYLIPSSIQQRFICCFSADKLCNFISLIDILRQKKQSAVCFCDTVDTVHRLKRVVEIAFNVIHKQSIKVAECSRLVTDRMRPHILREFRANKINFLICSDSMSRGMDLPSLQCVINYEYTKNLETYVHRIGRTARGVGNGTAYTILMQKEKKMIREMLKCAENGDKLQEYNMDMKVIRFHRKYIDKYTELLHKVLNLEQNGEIDHNDAIDSDRIKLI